MEIGRDGFLRARDSCAEDNFDCTLLDIMMPGMSGIDACQQLRIIAYTAHALPAKTREIKAAGFVDILIKPIDIHSLPAMVVITAQ